MTSTYVFDACALIAYFNKEPGSIEVKELIDRAGAEEITICMNIVNLVEVYYGYIHVTKDSEIEGAEQAEPLSVFWIKRQ